MSCGGMWARGSGGLKGLGWVSYGLAGLWRPAASVAMVQHAEGTA